MHIRDGFNLQKDMNCANNSGVGRLYSMVQTALQALVALEDGPQPGL